ncbi:MAG: outer membrane protein assembly factor BamE [Zetaproteobacteria bacterium]|nr:MAG: outer membrane protein assembly factor BamE [Zetaproteobacteria bacterium]
MRRAVGNARGRRRMADARGFARAAMAGLLGVLLAAAAGCGTSSESKPPAQAAPAPAPAPRPSLKEAGARIADEEALKRLVQGKTTKAEVRERFGTPQEVVLSPGVETFIYYRDRTSGMLRRTTERVEMLTVRFDPQGLLKDFEYRFAGK